MLKSNETPVIQTYSYPPMPNAVKKVNPPKEYEQYPMGVEHPNGSHALAKDEEDLKKWTERGYFTNANRPKPTEPEPEMCANCVRLTEKFSEAFGVLKAEYDELRAGIESKKKKKSADAE